MASDASTATDRRSCQKCQPELQIRGA